MPKILAGDIELYYEIHGEGVPLVLIPGFASGLWIWFKQVPALSREFRTIVFDPRGVSRSGAPERPVSIRTIADDVAAMLKALDVVDAHILGASFGGFVAQEFALTYPSMTRSLTLCCTSFGGPHHVAPSPETLAAFASTGGLNTEGRVREHLLLAFSPLYVKENEAVVERFIDLRTRNFVPESVYLHQLQAAVAFNVEERVSEIEAPTLVISGDADIIVPSENSRNLAASIPNAQLVVVPHGSHTFFIERADEFNQAVINFIKQSEALQIRKL